MCRRWKYIFEADFNSRKIGPIKSVHTNPPGVVDNSKRFKNKWLSRSNRAFSMSVEDAGLKSFELLKLRKIDLNIENEKITKKEILLHP